MAKRTGTSGINCDECVICHKRKKTKLVNPMGSTRPDRGESYQTFISDIESWNQCVETVEPYSQFKLSVFDEGNGVLQGLIDNKAKWHK